MPEGELKLELFRLFGEYKIWPFNELKARTHQPQSHLRDILPQIAFQHGSGDLSGKWELKADFRHEVDGSNAARVAPDTGIGEDSEMEKSELDINDDDEDDEMFENAL